MLKRRRELGLAQEGIGTKYLWVRTIISSLGLTGAAALILGIVIFISVYRVSS